MTTTRSELLDVVYQFYPRGMLDIHRMHVPPGEAVYEDTEENLRLIVAAARGRRAWRTWDQMLDRLRIRFSLQDESLHLLSGGIHPAYSGRVWLIVGKTSINFHVSLLGPYYMGSNFRAFRRRSWSRGRLLARLKALTPGIKRFHPRSAM